MSGLREQLSDAHVLVVGCGASGVSAARFAYACGASVRVVDSRAEPPGESALYDSCPRAGLITGEFNPVVLDGIDRVVVSPGVDLREPLIASARERGLPVLLQIPLVPCYALTIHKTQALQQSGVSR